MKTYNISLRPIHYACVSGGKDSLYMFRLLCNHQDKYPLDMVVHFELEIDYPFVKNVTDYIESCCNKLGIKFVRIKPRKSYYKLVEEKGMPSRACRWCNNTYKLDCEKQLKDWIKEQNCRPVAYIGLCADEQNRFKYTVGNIIDGQDVVYPLAEEHINENDILEWAKDVTLFDNWYKIFKRQGCMFCPNMTYKELAYLSLIYPNEYKWFMEENIKTEHKHNSGIFQSNPKYRCEYIMKIVNDKYVPLLIDEFIEKGLEFDEW